MRSDDLLHVEFAGIPGSGKTSICDSLILRLRERGGGRKALSSGEAFYEASKSMMDRFWRIFLLILPRSLALSLSDWLMNRSLMQFESQNLFLSKYGRSLLTFFESSQFPQLSINNKANSISFFMSTASTFETIKRSDFEGEVIFSEGFIQKAIMFLCPDTGFQSKKHIVIDYLQSIPVPDIVIYVSADIDKCLARMKIRESGLPLRLQGKKDEVVRDFLINAHAFFEFVVEYLEKNRHVKVLRINNNNSLSETLSLAEKSYRNVQSMFEI